ncbi:MAG: SRPBCC family protein [Deltaproteobacteria bacterium]|nr:SRPBCC family protein [Deltaproteobacteria bacterium]
MQTARFHLEIDAPLALVWEFITDYPGYARMPRVSSARVTQAGKDHPAGVGAVRELVVDGITFVEHIVEFEPPHVLAYKIERSFPLPIAHEIGRMRLKERPGGTSLDWETILALDVPLIGGLLTPLVIAKLRGTFNEILAFVKADLERRARAA